MKEYTVYRNYGSVPRGWHTTCASSPLPAPPEGTLTPEEAVSEGFEKIGNRTPYGYTEFVAVESCHNRGFKNSAAKTYYSVWGKEYIDLTDVSE